jgi:2-oxoglutarate dehydrogenase complex dehydrogenase (E1) component-like enzyme
MKFKEIVEKYPNASQFIWFQEEHRNFGPWSYIGPRISLILDWLKSESKIKTSSLDLVARRSSAATAVGKKKKHELQQAAILEDLFR